MAVPPGAAAGVWATRRPVNRSGCPDSNLHLCVRIAVYLVALGIPNRVCWRVVLEIVCRTSVMSRKADSGQRPSTASFSGCFNGLTGVSSAKVGKFETRIDVFSFQSLPA